MVFTFTRLTNFSNIKNFIIVRELTMGMIHEIGPQENICEGVVEAVSTAETKSPTSLPPLHYAINVDALGKLFEQSTSDSHGRYGQITFVFSESLVTVEYDENITVEPIPDEAIIYQEHNTRE